MSSASLIKTPPQKVSVNGWVFYTSTALILLLTVTLSGGVFIREAELMAQMLRQCERRTQGNAIPDQSVSGQPTGG